MGIVADRFAQTFRSYNVDGVPGSGPHEVRKADARALGEAVETAVSAAGAAIMRFETVALMEAETDVSAGQLAYVYNNNDAPDDPANLVYQWDDATSEWVEAAWYFNAVTGVVQPLVDDAEAAKDLAEAAAEEAETLTANAQPAALNTRIDDRPRRTQFIASEITGPFLESTGGTSSVPSRNVNVDGEMEISADSSGSNVRFWNVGRSWDGKQSLEVEMEVTLSSLSNTSGCAISLGSTETGFVNFFYGRNGVIGVTSSTNAPISTTTQASMVYTSGQKAKLRLVLRRNGSGFLVATHPGGDTYTFAFTGITARGNVGPAWVRQDSGTINSFRVSPGADGLLTDVEARTAALEAAVDVPSGTFSLYRWSVLPDASPGREPRGFTCTGLSRLTRGPYKGCWVVGDDGRLEEGDGSPYVPRVHIIDPEFRTILHSFDTGVPTSVQGVAVDTSGTTNTIWVATGSDQKVRHYQVDGTEIADDTIDMSNIDGGSITSKGNANGLAYDPIADALFLSGTVDGTVYKISCNPAASPRILDTFTLADNDPDQLCWVAPKLFYSRGNNGSSAAVKSFNPATTATVAEFTPLTLIEAPEGIFIDPDTKIMTVLSDGGYHFLAQPAINLWAQYRVALS